MHLTNHSAATLHALKAKNLSVLCHTTQLLQIYNVHENQPYSSENTTMSALWIQLHTYQQYLQKCALIVSVTLRLAAFT